MNNYEQVIKRIHTLNNNRYSVRIVLWSREEPFSLQPHVLLHPPSSSSFWTLAFLFLLIVVILLLLVTWPRCVLWDGGS